MTTLELRPAPLAAAPPTAPAPVAGRSLASYLLLPRPKDLIKAIVFPLGFLLGAAVDGVTWQQAARGIAVWVALELLVYQARYQWNDARGFAADQAHPEAASRGRLPGPVEKGRAHVRASLAVAALRILLTVLLALLVPSLRGTLVVVIAGVFGVAFVYERLRSAATGRTASANVPLRPSLVALWVAVGFGYAVRGLAGLGTAVDLSHRPGLVAVSAVAMSALGTTFVTCRWLLETMCFAAFRGSEAQWSVRSGQAREHTLALVRWSPTGLRAGVPVPEPCAWRALQVTTRWTAPWNLAVVVAGAAAALAGALLTGQEGVGWSALAALAGVAAAGATTRAEGNGRWLVALATAAGTGVLVALTGGTALSALPVLVVVVAYCFFTSQCADDIGRPLHRLDPVLRRG